MCRLEDATVRKIFGASSSNHSLMMLLARDGALEADTDTGGSDAVVKLSVFGRSLLRGGRGGGGVETRDEHIGSEGELGSNRVFAAELHLITSFSSLGIFIHILSKPPLSLFLSIHSYL